MQRSQDSPGCDPITGRPADVN